MDTLDRLLGILRGTKFVDFFPLDRSSAQRQVRNDQVRIGEWVVCKHVEGGLWGQLT